MNMYIIYVRIALSILHVINYTITGNKNQHDCRFFMHENNVKRGFMCLFNKKRKNAKNIEKST